MPYKIKQIPIITSQAFGGRKRINKIPIPDPINMPAINFFILLNIVFYLLIFILYNIKFTIVWLQVVFLNCRFIF
jgi:hypothetical protein